MKLRLALSLILATVTTGDTLQSIVLDYQEEPNLQRFAKWAKSYSSTGVKYYEWKFQGEWYANQLHIKRTVTAVTEYIDGVCVSRKVTEVITKDYGELAKPYEPRQYWAEPDTPEPTKTIDDLIKAAPDGFPVEVLSKLKEG